MDGVRAPCSPQNFSSFPKHLPVFLGTSQPPGRSGSSRLGAMKWWAPKLLLSNTIFPLLNLAISRRSEEATINLRERPDLSPCFPPLQTQVVEQPATSMMLCRWQGVPNVPRGRAAHNDGQRGRAAPPLPGSGGSLPWVNFSTEPQRATIILLTARGVFPDRWTRFLSLRIGKNLQSSKNGFQRALQVILKP